MSGDDAETRRELAHVTRLLCMACANYPSVLALTEVSAWHTEHQRKEAARNDEESERARVVALRKAINHDLFADAITAASEAFGGDDAVAEIVGVSRPTVVRWRDGAAVPAGTMQRAVRRVLYDRTVYP